MSALLEKYGSNGSECVVREVTCSVVWCDLPLPISVPLPKVLLSLDKSNLLHAHTFIDALIQFVTVRGISHCLL